MCSEIKCNRRIAFGPENYIGRLLRFPPRILAVNVTHTSDLPVIILNMSTLYISSATMPCITCIARNYAR